MQAKSQGEIFAVIADHSLYRSRSNGFDWELIPTTNLGQIKVDPEDTLWALTYPDIIIAPDDPANMRKVNFLPSNRSAIAITFTQKYGVIVLSSSREIYNSMDRGNTWQRRGALADSIRFEQMTSNILSHLYVRTLGDVYYSKDGGINWERIYPESPHGGVRDIVSDALGRIYVTTSEGLLRSSEPFRNWDNLLPEQSARLIAISSTGALAITTNWHQIFFSTDNGAKWHSEQSGIGEQVFWALLISPENYIYAGTQAFGAFRTTQKLALQPERFSLTKSFPNPFNAMTNIQFTLAETGYTQAVIYNILGQEVETLVDMELPAGIYTVSWQPSGVPSGLYLCRLKTTKGIETTKLLLVR